MLSQRLNFAVSPSLMDRLKRAAEAHETNVSEWVLQTLRQRLAQEQQREAGEGQR